MTVICYGDIALFLSKYLKSFLRINRTDAENENPKNIPSDPPTDPIKSGVDKIGISSFTSFTLPYITVGSNGVPNRKSCLAKRSMRGCSRVMGR